MFRAANGKHYSTCTSTRKHYEYRKNELIQRTGTRTKFPAGPSCTASQPQGKSGDALSLQVLVALEGKRGKAKYLAATGQYSYSYSYGLQHVISRVPAGTLTRIRTRTRTVQYSYSYLLC